MGGGGTSTNTVTKSDPYIGVQPGLNELYAKSLENFNKGGAAYYPGQQIADSNNDINSSLTQGWDINRDNLDKLSLSQDQLRSTAAGQGPPNPALAGMQEFAQNDKTNPYLDGLFNNATSSVTNQFRNAIAPGLASQFSAAGRTGSGAAGNAFNNASATLGQTLGQTANSIYGGAYESDRNRQFSALERLQQQSQFDSTLRHQAQLAVPGMQEAQQSNLSNLLGIGKYRQSQQQNLINADKARWDYDQNKQLVNLNNLSQLLNGGTAYASKSSSGTGTEASNPFQGALGGATTGYGLGTAAGGAMSTAAYAAAGGAASAGGGAAGAAAGAQAGGSMGLYGALAGAVLGGLFG